MKKKQLLEAALEELNALGNKYHKMFLTKAEFLGAMERLKQSIVNELSLRWVDSIDHGDKYTECTWGMCIGTHVAAYEVVREIWDDWLLHMWPEQFRVEGRIAPKYVPDGLFCPMDRRNPVEDNERLKESGLSPNHGVTEKHHVSNGCFYTCRIFQGGKIKREQALVLFDISIERLRSKG